MITDLVGLIKLRSGIENESEILENWIFVSRFLITGIYHRVNTLSCGKILTMGILIVDVYRGGDVNVLKVDRGEGDGYGLIHIAAERNIGTSICDAYYWYTNVHDTYWCSGFGKVVKCSTS